MKKIVVLVMIIILTLLMLSYCLIKWVMPALYLGGIIPSAPNYERMDKHLSENISELSYVAEQLLQLEYDYIAIRKVDGMGKVSVRQAGNYSDIAITDEGLIENIEKLYQKGFEAMFRYDNRYIDFSKWSALNQSRGIFYVLNDKEVGIEFFADTPIIDLKPLSIENWYYYEDNFEKWKYQNVDRYRQE